MEHVRVENRRRRPGGRAGRVERRGRRQEAGRLESPGLRRVGQVRQPGRRRGGQGRRERENVHPEGRHRPEPEPAAPVRAEGVHVPRRRAGPVEEAAAQGGREGQADAVQPGGAGGAAVAARRPGVRGRPRRLEARVHARADPGPAQGGSAGEADPAGPAGAVRGDPDRGQGRRRRRGKKDDEKKKDDKKDREEEGREEERREPKRRHRTVSGDASGVPCRLSVTSSPRTSGTPRPPCPRSRRRCGRRRRSAASGARPWPASPGPSCPSATGTTPPGRTGWPPSARRRGCASGPDRVLRVVEHRQPDRLAVHRAGVVVPVGRLAPHRQVVLRRRLHHVPGAARHHPVALRAGQPDRVVDAHPDRAFLGVAERDRADASRAGRCRARTAGPPAARPGGSSASRRGSSRRRRCATRSGSGSGRGWRRVLRLADLDADDPPVVAALGPEIDAVDALVRRLHLRQVDPLGDHVAVAEPDRLLVDVVGRLAGLGRFDRPAARDRHPAGGVERAEERLGQRLGAVALPGRDGPGELVLGHQLLADVEFERVPALGDRHRVGGRRGRGEQQEHRGEGEQSHGGESVGWGLLRPLEAEEAGVPFTGIEPDELLVVGPADPVVDAAVLLAQVGRPLEQDAAAGLPAVHLHRVLVRPAALPLEHRRPTPVLGRHQALHRHAVRGLVGCALGLRVERPPGADPLAGHVRGLLVHLGRRVVRLAQVQTDDGERGHPQRGAGRLHE